MCCVSAALLLLLFAHFRVISDEMVLDIVNKYSDLTGGKNVSDSSGTVARSIEESGGKSTGISLELGSTDPAKGATPVAGSISENVRVNPSHITGITLELDTSDPTRGAPPAYVISLVKCGGNPTGFLDAAAVFLESVRMNSATNPESGGRYGYAAYAIVHKQCEQHAALLERVGYKTMIKDTPFKREDIRGDELRNSIENALCCGSPEYIKLYAYTLTDHPVVLHFDIDCIVTRPLDELFDAMLYPNDHKRYKAAMESISLERKNDPIPERIDAFLSMDYSLNWPWHREAPAQGGWLAVRPSQKAFDEYMDIVLEGNYTGGFDNNAGWGGIGFGGWVGGAAIQGIVAYYYGHFHRGGTKQNYVELDVCRYNQIGADMIWRKNGDMQGHCRKFARNPGEEHDCTDCRNTDIR